MKLCIIWSVALLGMTLVRAAEPPRKEAPDPSPRVSSDELYQAGKDLFDALATPEIKEQYEFPDKARWDEFAGRLQRALESSDLVELAQYEPEARAALVALRTLPGNEQYIDWLEERLDYIEAAEQTTRLPPASVPAPGKPVKPTASIPHYDLWLQRMKTRSKPAAADRFVPTLGPVFTGAGLPSALVWLAEVESTFNPAAGSPAGAKGLFQLMPATAKELGLSTFLPDERTHPAKSAGAAAQLLGSLYKKFGDWPLALAAYNAGPGRVQRTLTKHHAKTFAEIASVLPSETRMYVPKVLATLEVRAGVTLAELAAPR